MRKISSTRSVSLPGYSSEVKDPCSFVCVANVLVLEPWYQGSHRSWVEGWRSNSRHTIDVVNGSDSGWRRSLVTAPTRFAEAINETRQPIDALVASTPIDLATVFGLVHRSKRRPPTLLYMHESQIGYPPGPKGGQPYRAMINDWNAITTADRIAVATQFHADLLVEKMPDFANGLVHGSGSKIKSILNNVHVLPVGIAASGLRPITLGGPIRVLWNHRWSHDKNPGEFVHAVTILAAEGHEFELYALGEVEPGGEKAYGRLKSHLADRVLLSGRQTYDIYRQVLCRSDVVISTAQHEFFGLAVAEAIAAGARPLLPDRLAYPEIVPDDLSSKFLYRGSLEDALRSTLTQSRDDVHRYRQQTMEYVSKFSWRDVTPQYDSLIDEMLATTS